MKDVAMLVTLAISTGGVLLFLWVLHRDPEGPFDLVQLVKEPGEDRLSLSRTGTLSALIVSTWAFVWLVTHDKLTEWYFAAYMLTWTGQAIASRMTKAAES